MLFRSGSTSPDNTCYQFEEHMKYGDLLFDLEEDGEQRSPIKDAALEQKMIEAMRQLMAENEAPEELYKRIGVSPV